MIASILTIALSACQGYAERLPYAPPEILALYHAACALKRELIEWAKESR